MFQKQKPLLCSLISHPFYEQNLKSDFKKISLEPGSPPPAPCPSHSTSEHTHTKIQTQAKDVSGPISPRGCSTFFNPTSNIKCALECHTCAAIIKAAVWSPCSCYLLQITDLLGNSKEASGCTGQNLGFARVIVTRSYQSILTLTPHPGVAAGIK